MAYFDATSLWGGDPDKANASIEHDFANSEITIGSGGQITNDNGDYSITNQGMNIDASTSFLRRRAYTIGDNIGAFWGDSGTVTLEARGIPGPDLLLNSVGGDVNLKSASASASSNINVNGTAYFRHWLQNEDETRQATSSGEQAITVGAPIVRLTNTHSSSVIARIDLANTPDNDRSMNIVLVNDSGNSTTLRDKGGAGLSGANIRTSGGVDREFQNGARIDVVYIASTGNYHISQDRT